MNQQRTWNRQVVAGLPMLGLLGLMACSPVEGEPGEGSNPEDESAASEGSLELDPEGVLDYAHFRDHTRFDPHRATNSHDANSLFLTYDRLVHMTEEAEPEAGLAEDWEFVDEGRALELRLRQDVVFHDGAAFDAEAVKANIERAQTIEGSAVVAELADVEEVVVVDDHTVRLELSRPNASIVGALADRAGAMISPEAFENDDLDTNPVGSGMYEVVEYRQDELIVYERFDDYWNPDHAALQTLNFHILPDDTTRLNALRSDQVDAAVLGVRDVEEAEAAGFEVNIGNSLQHSNLYLNRAESHFDDTRVRRAMSHAIDREAIVEGVLFGHGTPNMQPFPEGYYAFNEELGTLPHDYDPERARELLAEAGLEGGFEFTILIPTASDVPMAETLAEYFGAVGIDVTLQEIESAQATEAFYMEAQGEAMTGAWGGRPDPSMTFGLRWVPGGLPNPGDHSTPRMEELYEQSIATVDPVEREQILQEASAEFVEEMFELVIYSAETPMASTDEVHGLEMPLSGWLDWRGVGVE